MIAAILKESLPPLSKRRNPILFRLALGAVMPLGVIKSTLSMLLYVIDITSARVEVCKNIICPCLDNRIYRID